MAETRISRRMQRERRTIRAMVAIYCRAHHPAGGGDKAASGEMCPACGELLRYAEARLDRCVFGDAKPVCAKCPVHCYRPAMRQQVIEVMRYAGPRMLRRHPYLALMHLADKRRPAPARPPQRREAEGA